MSQPEQARIHFPRRWIIALAVAVAAILPFATALGGGFIYDDFTLIVGNELVRGFDLVALWTSEFFHDTQALHFRYFRPLVTTSWAIDWALWGGHPGGFHATNLAIHAAVSCLVFLTLRRWSGREGAALVATLIWAWHPTKTEAVVWISGRTDLLCTFGLLLATLGAGRRFRRVRFALPLEFLGIALAFTAKEAAVVLPGLIAVEAWATAGRPALDLGVIVRAIRRALPHGGIVLVYLLARALILPIEPKEFAHDKSLRDVALFAVETWGETAKSLFWPWPLTMHRAPIYVDEAKNLLHDPLRLALGGVVVIGLVASVIATARRRPMIAVGLLLATFLFLPVANLRPTRMPVLTAERFTYLPSLGLALAIVGMLPRRRAATEKVVYAGIGLGLVGAVTASVLHTANLQDERKFWTHELKVHPKLPTAVRAALQIALGERRYEDALELTSRGYEGAKAWTIAHPFDVEFSLYAAQIRETTTLDRDAASLAAIAEFFRAFFLEKTKAELETSARTFVTHGGRNSAAWLQQVAPARFAGFQAIGARALARAGDCDGALTLAREARGGIADPGSRTTAILVLARCGAWDEALALTSELPEGPVREELVANLQRSRAALEEIGEADDIEAAIIRSRVGAMLLDRKRAFTALAGHEDELLTNPQGALYFARTAWAAGEDEAAMKALARFVPEQERNAMLAAWSKELGRKGPAADAN